MTDQLKLAVKERSSEGKSYNRNLRRSGSIPGVVYGGKDQPKNLFIESNLIDIDYHDKKFIVLTDSLLLRYDFFD